MSIIIHMYANASSSNHQLNQQSMISLQGLHVGRNMQLNLPFFLFRSGMGRLARPCSEGLRSHLVFAIYRQCGSTPESEGTTEKKAEPRQTSIHPEENSSLEERRFIEVLSLTANWRVHRV